MKVKKVILDGFKSYGKRTEVGEFDPEFTAITGLNGTGKSNILDSICFVLGISNLGHVRATSLQELIFKNGQAGVTKASVTIIFDNTDPKNCPIGYEDAREIVVSRQVCVGGVGKNKYFINGKTVLNKKVIDLFCSIQMNVNNPNFLIMQGRITKVLNMKPLEILSMIEEASGTSLYETKRGQTEKIIAQKDTKLQQMNEMMQEDIIPRMDKLRTEQAKYQDFLKLKREIDHLTHIHISFIYLKRKKGLENCQKSIDEAKTTIENGKKETEENITKMAQIDEECKEIEERISSESGGELVELEKELAVKSKTEATANGAKKSASAEVEAEKRKLKMLQKNLAKDEESLQTKESKMSNVGDLFQQLKDADEADSKAFSDAQKRFQALSAGLEVNEDGQATSLQGQLTTTKTKLTESTTTVKNSEMELKHITKELKTKEAARVSGDASYTRHKQNLENKEKEIAALKNQLSKVTYEEGAIDQLEERQQILNDHCRQVEYEVNRMGGHRYEVQYTDPHPNFDRRTVKGMVCKLFKVRDEQYSTALSTVAGGKLFNLVVDDEKISKLILQKGNLQTRTTIIPISKIRGGHIPPQKVKAAQNFAGAQNCIPALDLIEYNPSLRVVMEHVFGGALICSTLAVAKQVCFHPQVKVRCITLDGDSVEPAGTLSGGAASKQVPVLVEIAKIQKRTDDLNAKRAELRNLQEEIRRLAPTANQYRGLKQNVDSAEYELDAIKKLLAGSKFQQHQQEIENARERIRVLQETIENAKKEQETCKTKIKEYEANLADAKGYRDRQLKEAKDNMQKLDAKAKKSKNEWQQREKEAETLKLEIEELKTSIEAAKAEIAACEAKIQELQDKLDGLVSTTVAASTEIKTLRESIQAQKDSINSKNHELRLKQKNKERLNKKNGEIALQMKKKEAEMERIVNDNQTGLNYIAQLEEKYPWIETDFEYFGVKNTKYDYSKENPEEAGAKLRSAEERFNKEKTRVNEKAMMLLEREEEELKQVEKRKKTVENDRTKITNILEDLDKEKEELLRQAWKEVDKNFGSIFSVLLPGAEARLVPTPGKQFHEGLNIKVGFNGVWKDTLTELSGGQRSLVALSLILAMLKYKPAPIYILDEVDAALDMSHTQNIGQMLKMHFTNSQFIIVSLKDGMFNNANVIFKTKFENGVSGVIRTQNNRR